ncbi:MAG: hypothetical protein AB7O24_09580 [Kofleriaceae bacterium]
MTRRLDGQFTALARYQPDPGRAQSLSIITAGIRLQSRSFGRGLSLKAGIGVGTIDTVAYDQLIELDSRTEVDLAATFGVGYTLAEAERWGVGLEVTNAMLNTDDGARHAINAGLVIELR